MAGAQKKAKPRFEGRDLDFANWVRLWKLGLLIVAHGQFGGDGFEVAKEAACALVWTGGEVKLGGGSPGGVVAAGGGAVAGAESPQAVDGERVSACVSDQAEELAGGEVIGGNGPAAFRAAGAGELAYEQRVAENAEVERRESYAPGRVEPVAVFEALKKSSIGGEDINVAQAGTIGFERVAFLVEDVGDDDVVPDGLDVEGHEIPGQTIVGECLVTFVAWAAIAISVHVWLQINFVEGVVVDVDGAPIEVGGVEVALALDGGAGEAGVAGAVGGLDHDDGVRGGRRSAGGYCDGWVPSGDSAVNGREEKGGGRACSQEEVRRAGVGDGAGGRAGGEGLAVGVGFGNGHDEWVDDSSAVIEGTQASAVVGDPPGAARRAGESPGIDEMRIGDRSYAGCVRYKIDLGVVLRVGK
jgi:hypothetical protein